ncbi:MAG: GNAT family N-acetyltransferase [Pseudomonadota bacterium]
MRLVPLLETERLRLRGPDIADMPAVIAYWATDRSVYEGGPRNPNGAYEDYTSSFACWLVRGYGCWALEERASGSFLGIAGVFHPNWVIEPDLGWTLLAEAEGKGYAHEAALAARDWVYRNTEIASLTSNINRENARSIRLAARLGAAPDEDAPDTDDETIIYRHISQADYLKGAA